jgi:hypothetical protein
MFRVPSLVFLLRAVEENAVKVQAIPRVPGGARVLLSCGVSRGKRRQFVVLGPALPGESPQSSSGRALGSVREVRAILAAHNTSDDGGGDGGGGEASGPTQRLYGPGMTIELALSSDPVMQAIASVNDESTAWPVLARLCQSQGWRLMDIESGRVMSW